MNQEVYKARLAAQLRGAMGERGETVAGLAARADMSVAALTKARGGKGSDDLYRRLAWALGVSWESWVADAEGKARGT